jgi:hypothetical protein
MDEPKSTPAQDVTPPQPQPQQPTPQATPAAASAPTKEAEPVGSSLKSEVQPVREKKLSPEVIDYIKKREESIKIPQELKKIGITSSDDNPADDLGPKLPLSDSQIISGQKYPVTSSLRWLSEFALYLLRQMHYNIKVVNGHIKRVFYQGKD